MKHPYSKIILGIIWGFGLSCILAKSCKDGKCIIYKIPKKDELENTIYEKDHKCFQYASKSTQCPLKTMEV